MTCSFVSKFNVVTPLVLSALFLISVPFGTANAQQKNQKSIKVMLLGTVHLDNPGRDAINLTVPDVLKPEKQKELQIVRDAIADFQPNKVALEVQQKHQASFDSLYQKFHAGKLDSFSVGDFVSKRSEQFQIGFKLADRFEHDHVWAVDHYIPMMIGKVMNFAKKHDPGFVEYIKGYKTGKQVSKKDSLLQHGTLLELYRYMNTQEAVKNYRAPYVRMSSVGNDTAYVGADVVVDYHRRNLRIYANLMKIAEPGDRIFMMFGAGHQPFLRPLLKNSPRVEFVDPMEYLE